MTTSAFRLRATTFAGLEPKRTRRSATAPVKSVRFATSPAERQCSIPKEPSNPDLSSLGPIITKINKKSQSESAKTVKDEAAREERLHGQQFKPNHEKLVERPKTAPTKPLFSPMEVKDIEMHDSTATASVSQASSSATTAHKPFPILKPSSAPPRCSGLRTKFRLEGEAGRSTVSAKMAAESSTSQVVNHVREQTNHATHMHTRMMRHGVAVLRSKLIKLEEELRLAAKSRSLLEAGLQDIRKSMSVNHQAISTNQRRKKSSEESLLKVLMEESQVLSSCKRSLEQHLMTVKSNLHTLDGSRKDIESKISVLGRALALDAQKFKVFNGPLSTKGLLISRQRHYSTSSKPPSNMPVDQEIIQFLSRVSEVIKVSKKARGDLLAFLVSMKSTRSTIHSKVTDAMSTAVKEATGHRQSFELQRGRVKLEKHWTSRQKHAEEISLGQSLGPHSEHYREASEKLDRPLSRLRPEAIPEERATLKETSRAVSRQLSATTLRDTKLSHSEQKLKKRIRDKSSKAGSISKTLRIRKASLDQKWVES